MRKILFLLLITISGYSQTLQNPTYGTVTIKNSATVTTTPALTTTEATGLQKKIDPVNLPISTATGIALDLKANDADVLHKNTTPETKQGGLTLGTNIYHASDNWIALGTSVTHDGNYTVYMGAQLGLIVNNFGVSGSTSNNLASQYTNIPTLNSGNIDSYRLLSIEHGINDAVQGVTLATFRTNLENCITNAKGKGWNNNKILIINSNYCTNPSVISLQTYADEAVLIAKEQGIQYVDIYNYTKNNGGGSLLLDGIHPSPEGGKIYARGVTSGMYGGLEATNAINSVNGINAFGNIVSEKKLTVGDVAQAHQLKILHTSGEALASLPPLGSSSEKFIYTNANVYGLVGDVLSSGTSYFQSQRTDGTVASFPLSLQPKGGNIYFGSSASIGVEKFQFSGSARFSSDIFANDLRIGRGGSGIISNQVVGVNSLANTNSSTADNTAVGSNILTSLVSGSRNTGVGAGALFKTLGSSNSSIGAYSLYENTTGTGNLAGGFQAGTYLADGTTPNANPNSSVYLGRETKAGVASPTNEVVIGYQTIGNGTNSVTLGNNTITKTYLKGVVDVAAMTIQSPIAASAGAYEFLTHNTSTLALEKVSSANVATSASVALKADIASPTFTGTVTAPAINLSVQTASTIAMLDASKNIVSAPIATYPSLTELSYGKGVTSPIQAQIDSKANIASPALTGAPTAPTATLGTNTTQIATTAFVQSADSGNVKLTGNQSVAGEKTYTDKAYFKTVFMQSATSATTLYIDNSANGIGIRGRNLLSGDFIYCEDTGTGNGFVSNVPSGTGFNFVGRNNGVDTYTVDKLGQIKSNALAGTGLRLLVADASGNITPATTLPVFADNTAAVAGGLGAGRAYRTATGLLAIVF
jgi:hypothetical protein